MPVQHREKIKIYIGKYREAEGAIWHQDGERSPKSLQRPKKRDWKALRQCLTPKGRFQRRDREIDLLRKRVSRVISQSGCKN